MAYYEGHPFFETQHEVKSEENWKMDINLLAFLSVKTCQAQKIFS